MQAETTSGTSQQNEPVTHRGRALPLAGPVRIVSRVVVGVAATGLALLMFLVAADVIGRYVLNRPIPGGYELTEYLMAIIVPLSIAFCAERKSHVGVDMVVEKLSPKMRARVEAVTLLVTLVLCAVLAWQCCVAIPESHASGLKSAVLHIPAYPTVVAVAIGMIALVFFVFAHFIERLMEVFST
jgi:TRAP-type C4-dicarboxylate transport system permease small subunit